MSKLLENVEQYWDKRSSSYSMGNLSELNSFKKEAWENLILEQINNLSEKKVQILDIGTGPGFFAILMANCGYEVTAIDYTEKMLKKAKENANEFNTNILFKRMDAHKLDLEDNTFDLIISRNLTWNLQYPDKAYKEWYRVLRKGGKVVIFDANWYLYLYDDQKRIEHEKDRLIFKEKNYIENHTGVNIKVMEDIARNLPLSKENRPAWDTNALLDIGFKKIKIDLDIWKKVWDDKEKIKHASTPLFMISAEK